MKLSFTIVAYNRPKLLERALNSIANQSDKRWEVFIANDHSSDPEVERIATDFFHQYGGGYGNSNVSDDERLDTCRPSVCINLLLPYLTGEVWWNIADDMELANESAVNSVLSFFEQRPEVKLAYAGLGYRLVNWRTGEPIDAKTVREELFNQFPNLKEENSPFMSDFTKRNLVIRAYPNWVNYGGELNMAFSLLDGGQFVYRKEYALAFPEEKKAWMGEDAYRMEEMVKQYGPIYPILNPNKDILVISNLNEASLTVQGSPEKSIAVTK